MLDECRHLALALPVAFVLASARCLAIDSKLECQTFREFVLVLTQPRAQAGAHFIDDLTGPFSCVRIVHLGSVATDTGRHVIERNANLGVPNGQGQSAYPAMKRLAQLVYGELLDAEEDDRVGAVRDTARAHRPARDLAAAARVAAAGEDADCPLHHGMRKMHEQRVATGLEHTQAPESLDERLRAEGEARHRATAGAAWSGASHRLVDDVAPAREIRANHPVEAGLLGNPKLGPAVGNGHRGLQRIAKSAFVQIDLRGHRIERHRLACLLLGGVSPRCRIDFEDRAAAGRVDPPVQIGSDGVLVLSLNQTAVHGTIEDFVGGAQVLADLVRLADHVTEKAQIGIGIADEVVHCHVASLAVAVEPAVALLQP